MPSRLACFVMFVVACSRPTPPTLLPKHITLMRIDPQGVELRLELDAANPNSVDLSASDVTSRVVVGGAVEERGIVRLPAAIILPAARTTRIDVPLSLDWPSLGALATLMAAGGAVPYSVDGTLDLGGSLLHVGVPFHFEGSIPRDQIVSAVSSSVPGLSP
ncbi:MAG: LEA type 2 family protein [Myxococcota bacterium]|nr:LEA type 2 family protein [Myxococcota bacterium]